MEIAILSLIVLLTLVVWRLAFTGLQRRRWFGGIAAAHDNASNACARMLEQPPAVVTTGDGGNPRSYRINPIKAESRAETYLRRTVAIVGATQKGNGYVLDVGTTRFQVHDRYVKRLRDVSDPMCACFSSVFQGLPTAELIAAALLQLRNNPSLFDKWALQRDLAFKADGEAYAPMR